MTFSETVAQQRKKDAIALKRFIIYSLAGSVVLHGAGLLLKVNPAREVDDTAREEITIVVTPDEEAIEAPTEDPPSTVLPEDVLSEDNPAQSSLAPPSAPSEPIANPTALIDAPVSEPVTPLEAPALEEIEEVIEEPAVEEPDPTPVAEAGVEPEITEPSPSNPPDAVQEATEATSEPSQNLSQLLQELRQARQRTGQAGNTTGQTDPSQPSNAGHAAPRQGETTAVAPTRSAPGAGSNTESPPRSSGSRSREITCRGCNFDYPESADGAEGTAQVIVETDERGRVVSVMLSRSSGNPALDQAALEQARRRVQLQGARAGESYPLDIDFVQPGSDAERRVRERGDRRSITVSDPEPESTITEEPSATPSTNSSASEPAPVLPDSEPGSSPEANSAPTPSPETSAPIESESVTPESSPEASPEASPEPSRPEAPPADVAEPSPEPEAPSSPVAPPASPPRSVSPPPAPAPSPSSTAPEPISNPEPLSE